MPPRVLEKDRVQESLLLLFQDFFSQQQLPGGPGSNLPAKPPFPHVQLREIGLQLGHHLVHC